MATVGIDLGTSYSVIAHLDGAHVPVTIPNSEGDLLTPSVVLFDGSDIVVGKEAVKVAYVEPGKVAQQVKREMGSANYSKSINGESLPPEVIQSFVLEKLKQDAQARIGKIDAAVITVPAYFDEPRRKATMDAGRLAGLNVIDIINEPTAAALAYGMRGGFIGADAQSRKPEKILVYDLGGGTFDVSLVAIDGKSYRVIATDGDVKLGGADWDRRIVDHLAEIFKKENGVDPRKDPGGLQRLFREAEDSKRALTAREATTVVIDNAGKTSRIPLTREQFESMTADLLERTRFTLTNMLKQANTPWKEVTRVVVVGGSSRMPMVAKMLEREAGQPVDRSLSPDEAVAHGAALYAGLLTAAEGSPRKNVRVTNVNSHNLGVLGVEAATGRARTKVLIRRNTAIPVTHTAQFKTHEHGQDSVLVKVIEGGDASGNNATHIGQCVIRDLPALLPAGTLVEVTFSYARNGRLTVLATLPGMKRQATVEIERASGLSEAKLVEWEKKRKARARPIQIQP